MCRADHHKAPICGVCVKLRNLVRVHYSCFHPGYTASIRVIRRRCATAIRKQDGEVSRGLALQLTAIDKDFIKTEVNNVDREEIESGIIDKGYQSNAASVYESSAKTSCGGAVGDGSNANSLVLSSQVLDTSESVPDTFVCFCGKRFKTAKEMKVHVEDHQSRPCDKTVVGAIKDRPYVCGNCNKAFRSKRSLKAHSYVHSQNKVHSCNVCGKIFRSVYMLKKHSKAHTLERFPKPSRTDAIDDVCKSNADVYELNTDIGDVSKTDVERAVCKSDKTGDVCAYDSEGEVCKSDVESYVCKTDVEDDVCKTGAEGDVCKTDAESDVCNSDTEGNLCKTYVENDVCKTVEEDDVCKSNAASGQGSEVAPYTEENEESSGKGQDVKPFICSYCNKICRSQKQLTDHEKKHNSDSLPIDAEVPENGNSCKSFECACGKSFETAKELRLHDKTHKVPQDPELRPYMCYICDFRFTAITHMRAHLKTHRIFECVCRLLFPNKAELNRHKLTHAKKKTKGDDSRPYVCAVCDRKFKQLIHLRAHKRLHGMFDCALKCGQSFSSQKELDKHKLTHDELFSDRPFKCVVCFRRFRSRVKLRGHESIHLPPYHCDICGENSATLIEMREHCFTTHSKHFDSTRTEEQGDGNGQRFDCSQCSKTFPSRHRLRMHMISHDETRAHVCDTCNKRFKYRGHLHVHQQLHRTETHLCEECGATFPTRIRLQRHRRNHREKKLIHCGYCQKGFVAKCKLIEHERTHTGVKPYTCEYCAMAFNNSSNLTTHIRIHKGERRYKCDQCDFAAVQPSTLKYHKLQHTDTRNYQCNICLKRFRKSYNLKQHLYRHRGIKNHQCNVCSKAFVSASELTGHLVSHSDERPHRCEHCSAAFKRHDHILAHMRSHHPDQLSPAQREKKFRRQGALPSRTAKAEASAAVELPTMHDVASLQQAPATGALRLQTYDSLPMQTSDAATSVSNASAAVFHM